MAGRNRPQITLVIDPRRDVPVSIAPALQVDAAGESKLANAAEMRQIFNEFDVDKSGRHLGAPDLLCICHDIRFLAGEVDADELRQMAQSLGVLLEDATLARMIKEADTDGNHQISFSEVCPSADASPPQTSVSALPRA